jgi:hypothetical protein
MAGFPAQFTHWESRLRNVATIGLFLLAVCLGLGGGHAQAQNGTATFNLTNNARYQIFIKFYSQDTVWPGVSSHYILADNLQHSFPLACTIGEKICYGGGYSQNGSGSYWGIGFFGNQGCSACCLICGPNNPTANWSLND